MSVAVRCMIKICLMQNGKSLRFVFFCFVLFCCNGLTLWWFGQESLPIFQRLSEISKLLDGENYVLSSTYCSAMFDVEETMDDHVAYSAPIAAIRQAMYDDHFSKRLTLEQSLCNVLHVLMTLLDPRYIKKDLDSFSFFVIHHRGFASRWRVNCMVKLTADQWNRAKYMFLQSVPQFFPNNCMLPVFVPLHDHVLTKLKELQHEIDDLNQPALSAESADADRVVHNHPRHPADLQVEQMQPHKKRRHIDHGEPPAIDMDGEMQVEEKKEVKEERDVQWELAHWFSPAAPFLPWYAPQSQPDVQWKALESEFPRLALLARRFLSIPPTSAPSERVWSRFGRVISKQSSTIDSTIAAQIMFLCDNEDLLNSIHPFNPNS